MSPKAVVRGYGVEREVSIQGDVYVNKSNNMEEAITVALHDIGDQLYLLRLARDLVAASGSGGFTVDIERDNQGEVIFKGRKVKYEGEFSSSSGLDIVKR